MVWDGFLWVASVKIAGMIDESMDKEQLEIPPTTPNFVKTCLAAPHCNAAGVFVNLILGILIFGFTLLHYENHISL